ncbi:3-methyl-2-oxobutanoate hydroxymethyltransferase [Streptomyces cellulosae]|uniref:3-methyl-2-oxobutanoate hydroxymethyltransferase n=1 Tax=Streptomyces cellulosae TaxID=1968 RepID=UPI00224C9467|nr:3-methyl-2-oxobutanoate hydroxymethyltransferase [Streptomyces cellulosae]WTB85491.1 3-methyl-2-oxobutanoate hydroxymethyltransferase [Streptomyces cellulosae]WTC59725.1 3-methyl-2-oxobutanoate hydroxymethyltransferase [Streptomyces cellulosae]
MAGFEKLSVPVGPSSCARAATSKEAAFRIDHPLPPARNTRVVALDEPAAGIVRDAAALEWGQARFFTVKDPGPTLVEVEGGDVALTGVLEDTNTVVMVSVTGENADAVAVIGTECGARGIMTAGLVVTPGALAGEALLQLRPYARILLAPAEADDLVELLKATRA